MSYNFRKIVKPLLSWYDKNGRSLPWREEPTPYHVWVSEIMLQQTRVEAVREYYKRFLEALPRVEDLANASEDEILKLWEGLGYYNRVRNMQLAAKTVVKEYDGKIPADYEVLLTLKGIGNYTAGAISSIAYGKQVPAVDGNVLRVMKRLSGSYDDISKDNEDEQKMEEHIIEMFIPHYDAFAITTYKPFIYSVANFIHNHISLKAIVIPAAKGVFLAALVAVPLTFVLSFAKLVIFVSLWQDFHSKISRCCAILSGASCL